MSFTSPLFLAFVIPVLVLYWRLRHRGRLLLLLGANYLFYAWWDLRLAWVLPGTTAFTFICGRQISQAATPAGKRFWLTVSLVGGIGLLAWFKYFGFFANSLVIAAHSLGWELSPVVPRILLPLGISYFTFQMSTYALDIYRGEMGPARSLLTYSVYASFFPQIVAGPITRARQLLPQLEGGARFSFEQLEWGLRRILLGLFMKVFVADNLAHRLVDPVFGSPAEYAPSALVLAAVGYACQLYADFSGYSSMAIGVARLFGLRLPENFRSPYLSLNIAEFWRRWHITLSRWLRDYLWWALARRIPFAGGLSSRLRGHAALLFVFLICGLWHGTAWTFVAWGGLHGIYVVVYEIWRRWRDTSGGRRLAPRPFGTVAAWMVTQSAIVVSMVLFRAASLEAFGRYLRGLFGGGGDRSVLFTPLLGLAVLACVVDHLVSRLGEGRNRVRLRIPAPVQALAYVAIVFFLFSTRPAQVSPFIYYRF